MGKYQNLSRRSVKEKNKDVHVAWRGIGCLMVLVIVGMSIASSVVLINYGLDNRWPIPYQFLGYPRYPALFYASNGLIAILRPISNINHFYAYAVASILLMIFLGGFMSIIYAFAYRLVGPSRYGPLDVERPNVKVKKYKR